MGLEKTKCLLECNSKVPGSEYLRYRAASKYSFENGQAASDNNVVTDVLHDASGLTSHQSEQDRG